MKRNVFRSRDVRRAALLFALAGVCGMPAIACIIADPQSDLPQLPAFRPTIVHGSVVPPEGQILTTFPAELVVPVELVNPAASFQWRAFIDYDPVSGDGLANFGGSDGGSDDKGIRTIEVPLAAPPDLTACHKIEFLVANSFPGNTGRDEHTPDSLGGDIAVWIFAPSGNLDGCPVYDAGIVDSGLDGSGGGQQ